MGTHNGTRRLKRILPQSHLSQEGGFAEVIHAFDNKNQDEILAVTKTPYPIYNHLLGPEMRCTWPWRPRRKMGK